jgi:riboflavin kinase/FMN adenylyltransferase
LTDMQVFFGLDKIPEDYRGAVVTLGVFDGLHFAHQEILRRVIRVAKASQAAAMMITFDPHPRNVLAEEPDSIIPLLTTRAEKIKLLKTLPSMPFFSWRSTQNCSTPSVRSLLKMCW